MLSKRLNAICPYFTMFPLEFPLRVIHELKPNNVLDPFCGRGTTLFAARLLGVKSVGIDNNAVALSLARAKLARASPDSVVKMAAELTRETRGVQTPTGEFWTWCFDSETLNGLAVLRAALLQQECDDVSTLLRALVLGILHGPRNKGLPTYLSNQMPRTFASKPMYSVRYWQSRGMTPPAVDMLDAIERRARFTLTQMPRKSRGSTVVAGDAAFVLESERGRKFDLVLTSPPYFGMRTYGSDQWLRSWFLGGPPDVVYKASGALASEDEPTFTAGLAEVWRAAARRCRIGARLVVRFGALPSKQNDPEGLLLRSLRSAEAGWLVTDVRPALRPPAQRRQAEHFLRKSRSLSDAVEEIDVTAELIA